MTKRLSCQGIALISIIQFTALSHSTNVPPPTGSYGVGVRSFVMPFIDAKNPAWPGNRSTGYLAKLYYPTRASAEQATPYMDSDTAAAIEIVYGQNASTLTNLTTSLKPGAPIAQPPGLFPSLLFQPGFEGTSEMYTTLLAELASRGYAVASLDFPYEAPYLRYPNGTGVAGVYVSGTSYIDMLPSLYEVRLRAGMHFVKAWPALVEQLHAPFQTAPLGLFGQSFGGAASLGVADAIPDSNVVVSALNLDGGIYGDPASNSPAADIKRPVLLIGQTDHARVDNDTTWDTFPAAQTGWWRMLYVAGADHRDFSDITFWRKFQASDLTIDPLRMINITREFVTAFFNQTMLKQYESILDQPGASWPEVTISGEGNKAL